MFNQPANKLLATYGLLITTLVFQASTEWSFMHLHFLCIFQPRSIFRRHFSEIPIRIRHSLEMLLFFRLFFITVFGIGSATTRNFISCFFLCVRNDFFYIYVEICFESFKNDAIQIDDKWTVFVSLNYECWQSVAFDKSHFYLCDSLHLKTFAANFSLHASQN